MDKDPRTFKKKQQKQKHSCLWSHKNNRENLSHNESNVKRVEHLSVLKGLKLLKYVPPAVFSCDVLYVFRQCCDAYVSRACLDF